MNYHLIRVWFPTVARIWDYLLVCMLAIEKDGECVCINYTYIIIYIYIHIYIDTHTGLCLKDYSQVGIQI